MIRSLAIAALATIAVATPAHADGAPYGGWDEAAQPGNPSIHTHRNWRPCKYEDGSGMRRCIWDAVHMGNGQGDSVMIWNWGREAKVISHRRAHHLINHRV